jgi:Lon protease-like protein
LTNKPTPQNESAVTPSDEETKSLARQELVKPSTKKLLLVPVQNTVLFPHNMMPLVAGKDINADILDRAIHKNEKIGVIAIDPANKSTEMQHIHSVGTEGRIAKVIRFPDGTTGVLVQGTRRFRVIDEADTLRPVKKPPEIAEKTQKTRLDC